MSDDDDRDAPDPREDEDQKAILARRSRLIALAFSGLTTAAGCYESHEIGAPPIPRADAGTDASIPAPCLGAPLEDAGTPVPCLSAPLEDAGPTPCLDIEPMDAGTVEPMPCLTAPADDAGVDAAPEPCLSMA